MTFSEPHNRRHSHFQGANAFRTHQPPQSLRNAPIPRATESYPDQFAIRARPPQETRQRNSRDNPNMLLSGAREAPHATPERARISSAACSSPVRAKRRTPRPSVRESAQPHAPPRCARSAARPRPSVRESAQPPAPLRCARSAARPRRSVRQAAQPPARKHVELMGLGTIRSRSANETRPTRAGETGELLFQPTAKAAGHLSRSQPKNLPARHTHPVSPPNLTHPTPDARAAPTAHSNTV